MKFTFTGKLSSLWKIIWRYRVGLLLFILLLPAVKDLLTPGYFTMHDDMQVFRLYELDKCIHDGQIPCRWVPDGGYGYGYPLMQFYPPMPYYPMELLTLLGLGYFWPVKIMFVLSILMSGWGMYLLAKEFFGKWGGIISSLLYVYAPYHSVDVYVRGAQNEAWGMVWFPFVLLFLYNLIVKKFSWKNFLLFAVCLAGQLTSHNVMTMVFAPSALLWAIFWIWRTKKYSTIKPIILSGLLGVGLSAFFFIPEVLEQKYVHVDSMISGYFNFMAHYADINQLFFSRFWGYGGSTYGPEDGMSFSVGQIQLAAVLIASLIALFRFKKDKTVSLMVLMATALGFVYAFLTHSRSFFIWDHLSLLQYAQFPWRLVALIVFYFSLAAGYITKLRLPKIVKPLLFVIASLGIILTNITFFHVERHTRVSLAEKMAGRQWELQVTSGIFDYLPRTAAAPPGDPAFTIPQYIEGYGGIENFVSGTNWMKLDAKVSSSSAKIMLPLFSFPGLVTKMDGHKVTSAYDPDLGRVIITVPQGTHSLYAKIGYTPIRLFSDLLTLSSIFILLRLALYARRHP
ncbi:MAG TPA: glycosyltransferase family 39 protein [Candidatus Woesebacteria bacterium]|nr:glycosyltransferase family 39 protein [Candidatus Woesebacteria bacterium]